MEHGPPKSRPSRACKVCHEKKIRCDLLDGQSCSNCRIYGTTCEPHQRQRKRKRPVPTSMSPAFIDRSPTSRRESGNLGLGLFSPAQSQRNPSVASLPGQAFEGSLHSGISQTGRSHHSEGYPTTENQDAPEKESSGTQGYLGRSEYLGLAKPQPNEISGVQHSGGCTWLSREERAVLEVYREFDLPSTTVQRSLIDGFETHCAPWMPVVPKGNLRQPHSMSILLLQSIFVAGSRVASASHISASAEVYYRRAKALFFSSYESNPAIKIAAACILNWYNPAAPEQVSLDGSSFWLRIAVSLAYQIGLHKEPPEGKGGVYRRILWWTLVARDCQLSSAHGRPRAVDLTDSDVALPSPRDFPNDPQYGALFEAFVKISLILGDTTQSYLRHQISPQKRTEIRNALYCWVSELPDIWRLFGHERSRPLNSYNMRARCLHVPYFVILTILYRSQSQTETSITIAAVASSFLAGIFEEFLARDEFHFQSPVFKFYAFAAGMGHIHARAYLSSPFALIEQEIDIINSSMAALATRWLLSNDNIKNLQSSCEKITVPHRGSSLLPLSRQHEAHALFDAFGPELCRLWHLIEPKNDGPTGDFLEALRPELRSTGDLPQACAQDSHRGIAEAPESQVRVRVGNHISSTDSYDPISDLPQTDRACDLETEYSLWDWSMIEPSGNWLLGEVPGVLS